MQDGSFKKIGPCWEVRIKRIQICGAANYEGYPSFGNYHVLGGSEELGKYTADPSISSLRTCEPEY